MGLKGMLARKPTPQGHTWSLRHGGIAKQLPSVIGTSLATLEWQD